MFATLSVSLPMPLRYDGASAATVLVHEIGAIAEMREGSTSKSSKVDATGSEIASGTASSASQRARP